MPGTFGVASELLAQLRARGWTIAVAESLTGGLLASALVEIPGASASLRGGVVAYDTAIKRTVLGVDPEVLSDGGPVQPRVAAQMAEGARRALAVDGRAADVGVATTGIAGPVSPDGQPVGTVDVGVSLPGGTRTERAVFRGDRDAIRAQAVRLALRLALDLVGSEGADAVGRAGNLGDSDEFTRARD
ncbi:CinA family protein [Microbacterium sp. Marseille-Q6965]|uniref:CinA family protein n=1 Tax=Microbacterium sp. Marseille-Q6965 TaxID=2965072 RepID=UPI0021B786B6|nr:CinA family protein [Microbacterium sp. Marseille-Q6965]